MVLVSPYSWLTEYTDIEEWVGGTAGGGSSSSSSTSSSGSSSFNGTGTTNDSASVLLRYMDEKCGLRLVHEEEMPFWIREHERKFQYGVSHATVFQKK